MNAECMYKSILKKIVEPLIGDKSTYQNELETACIRLLGINFKGVYPSDQIPVLNGLKRYAIINLDRSTEPGSHWVSIAFKDDKILVYDSFGRSTSKILPALYQSSNGSDIFDTDPDAEQTSNEMNCGARCLAWLLLFEHYGWRQAEKI
jgi:hypothetical protein